MDNTKGRTTAFATFSPFKSELARFAERLVLIGAPRNTAAVRLLQFLHTAHFARVSPSQLKRAGLADDRLRHGGFLFITAYNGDPETYFRGFSDRLSDAMNALWGCCVDWKGAAPFPHLDAFIRTFSRQSNFFFSAYPDTSTRIRASLVLRREIDKLRALALADVSDEEFKAAFDQVAQRHWGDADPEEQAG